jgi:hypothetical protein
MSHHGTFLEKHALLDAAITSLETADGPKRTSLLNGIWWLVDVLESESSNIPNHTHAWAEISDIKEIIEKAIKNPGSEINFVKLKDACYKLEGDAPEWHEPQ